MSKSFKKELKEYIDNSPEILLAQKEKEVEKIIKDFLKEKSLKTTIKIDIKKSNLTIITLSPSWRQEMLFFKKEIIKKIHKKCRNYNIEKINIL